LLLLNRLIVLRWLACSSERLSRFDIEHYKKQMQSVPITTNVVSSNPDHSEVYSIQHYLIKFVSELRKAAVFSEFSSVSSINKTDLM
jgi:hypothetical protein